jgi:hypothetical protein
MAPHTSAVREVVAISVTLDVQLCCAVKGGPRGNAFEMPSPHARTILVQPFLW